LGFDEGDAAGKSAAALHCFQHLVEDHEAGVGAKAVDEVQGLIGCMGGGGTY
jgi:hypothetical protein